MKFIVSEDSNASSTINSEKNSSSKSSVSIAESKVEPVQSKLLDSYQTSFDIGDISVEFDCSRSIINQK